MWQWIRRCELWLPCCVTVSVVQIRLDSQAAIWYCQSGPVMSKQNLNTNKWDRSLVHATNLIKQNNQQGELQRFPRCWNVRRMRGVRSEKRTQFDVLSPAEDSPLLSGGRLQLHISHSMQVFAGSGHWLVLSYWDWLDSTRSIEMAEFLRQTGANRSGEWCTRWDHLTPAVRAVRVVLSAQWRW